jgi:hypothetical protein
MSDKNACEIEIQYGELRKTFNANLRANCSSCSNVQSCDNENLSVGALPAVTKAQHPDNGSEMGGPDHEQDQPVLKSNKYVTEGQQLTSAGMRKLAKNWETCLCRIQVKIFKSIKLIFFQLTEKLFPANVHMSYIENNLSQLNRLL